MQADGDVEARRAARTVTDADAAAMRAILSTELGPLLTQGRVRVFAPSRWWDHDNEELQTERLDASHSGDSPTCGHLSDAESEAHAPRETEQLTLSSREAPAPAPAEAVAAEAVAAEAAAAEATAEAAAEPAASTAVAAAASTPEPPTKRQRSEAEAGSAAGSDVRATGGERAGSGGPPPRLQTKPYDDLRGHTGFLLFCTKHVGDGVTEA